MTISENDNVQQGAKTSRWALQSTFAMPPDVKMEVDDELRAAREDGDGDVEMEDETNHDDESNGVYQYTVSLSRYAELRQSRRTVADIV